MIILGVTRKIDVSGRLALPVELRHALRWEIGDVLSLVFDEAQRSLLLRKQAPVCLCCRGTEGLRGLPNGAWLCARCLKQLR